MEGASLRMSHVYACQESKLALRETLPCEKQTDRPALPAWARQLNTAWDRRHPLSVYHDLTKLVWQQG